jgi:F-box protein, helicase, 18
MLHDLPIDMIEHVTRYLSVKQCATLRCVSKSVQNCVDSTSPCPHATHVLRYDKDAVCSLSPETSTFPNFDVGSETIESLAVRFRTSNTHRGLKNKLRFLIHAKEHAKGRVDRVDGVTLEQAKIASTPFDPNTVLLVQAYAGTGKTRTLVEFAKNHDTKSILYLAYNRELCEDAKRRFAACPHVQVSTIHALAYVQYPDFDMGDSLTVRALMSAYPGVNASNAMEMIRIFDAYCHGSGNEHTDVSRRIWDDMFVHKTLPLTHDAYLKHFQVNRPMLKYDAILLDELQDCNDCIVDIVCQQRNTMKVCVGDMYQRLYGFRNVEDPYAYIQTHKQPTEIVVKRRLSVSFRVGFDLMYHVNLFLDNKFSVQGFARAQCENTRIIPKSERSELEIQSWEGPVTYICRFNINVIKGCIRFASQGKRVYIYGKTFDFDDEMEIVRDFMRVERQEYDPIVHKECRYGKTLQRLFEAYNEHFMTEWRQRWTLYDLYGEAMIDHWSAMKTFVTNDASDAEVILTTVHQAKGSEFDNVCLHDDLSLNVIDSLFVVYVAMTRAKKRLLLNTVMTNYFIKQRGFVYANDHETSALSEKCVTCKKLTSARAWMDVDVDAYFESSADTQLYERVAMCDTCKQKLGLAT